MPVTINGDGSITGLSVGGLGSGVVNTATLASNAITSAIQPAGSVIQVVNTNLTGTDSVSVPNGSLVDTPVTVNITSTIANSKFIIAGAINGEANQADHVLGIVMRRVIGGSGTSINIGNAAGSRTPITAMHQQGLHSSDNVSTPSTNSLAAYVDSPGQPAGTTITYKYALIGIAYAFTYYFGRSAGDTDGSGYERMPNHITVMEVAP